MKRILIFFLVLILAVAGILPVAAKNTKAESIIDEIIEYNLRKTSSPSVQGWIDGYLTENAGNGTEWYILALRNYGKYDFTSYTAALNDYLSENEVSSASSRLKFALTLIATGEKNASLVSEILENSAGEQGIMSLIFGLHILNNNYACQKYSVNSLTDELLSLQSADGGWSLTGTNGDADVTAMTIQVLAPQYRTNETVRTTVDKAIDFLSSRQNSDGSYSSYGVSNPESISQVIIALSTLGIDIEKDKRFIKNSKNLFDALETFHAEGGGYFHQKEKKADSTATVQVFCAAVAYKNMKDGETPFYIFSQKATATPSEKQEESTTTDITEKTVFQERTQASLPTEKTENISTSAQTVLPSAENEKSTKSDNVYKVWIILTIILIAVCLCVGLLTAKKLNRRNIIIIVFATVLSILIVFFIHTTHVGNSDYSANSNDPIITVTISIRCDTITDAKNDAVPENGIVLEETELQIDADDTVYDVLLKVCRARNIHLETTGTAETLYIEGICNIYEKDYGDLSGWMYFVNGQSPSVGCGKYKLSDNDAIVWCYTCDLGADIAIDSFQK